MDFSTAYSRLKDFADQFANSSAGIPQTAQQHDKVAETTTIEEYITGPESQTTAFKDCNLLADCADVLLNTIPLLQDHFEIIYINEEDIE